MHEQALRIGTLSVDIMCIVREQEHRAQGLDATSEGKTALAYFSYK
jgi:hypothetical protein